MESEKSKILIAEDEPDLLSIMDGLLSPHFDVVLAKDGFEAKKLIESHNFLFLILDSHLPDLSGLSLVGIIANQQLPPPMSSILMTT